MINLGGRVHSFHIKNQSDINGELGASFVIADNYNIIELIKKFDLTLEDI
jgi:hypothetical protein